MAMWRKIKQVVIQEVAGEGVRSERLAFLYQVGRNDLPEGVSPAEGTASPVPLEQGISEVIDISPGNLNFSLCFLQPSVSHAHSY